jgi:hypothetical protein
MAPQRRRVPSISPRSSAVEMRLSMVGETRTQVDEQCRVAMRRTRDQRWGIGRGARRRALGGPPPTYWATGRALTQRIPGTQAERAAR